jgi:hypothetical protein
MQVGRLAIAVFALSMSVLATSADDSVADQQAVRDWFCSKLEMLRPEAQAGITVTVSADRIGIDGVRSSSLAIVQSIAAESNTTQAIWINGQRYRRPVQTSPRLLNSRTQHEKYYDVIARSLGPAILSELERHRDWRFEGFRFEGFLGLGPNLRERTEVGPFPFPPPAPSAVLELPRPRPATTVDDLVRATRDILASAGYSYSTVSPLPDDGGFAVVAPLEQTDARGIPLRGNARFSPTIEPVTSGGVAAYLRALIAGRKGYWRVIVFVITDRPLPIGPQPTVAQLGGFQGGGKLSLAPSERKETLTVEHHVWAFIYEISAQENEKEATVVVPGRLSAKEHLKRAGLYWGKK